MTNVPDFQKGVPFDGTSGLLPAIAQDAVTGRVLMMAWMDQQAWQETLSSGAAVYFSRSRGKLWRKGETSGHRQRRREHLLHLEVLYHDELQRLNLEVEVEVLVLPLKLSWKGLWDETFFDNEIAVGVHQDRRQTPQRTSTT